MTASIEPSKIDKRTREYRNLSKEEKETALKSQADVLNATVIPDDDDEPEAAKVNTVASEASVGKLHHIHFVEDGFTAMGEVYYRGQELTVVEGSSEWEQCSDKKGKSWLNYTRRDQLLTYGKVFFEPGPWQGLTYEEMLDDPTLSDEEREKVQTLVNTQRAELAQPVGAQRQK